MYHVPLSSSGIQRNNTNRLCHSLHAYYSIPYAAVHIKTIPKIYKRLEEPASRLLWYMTYFKSVLVQFGIVCFTGALRGPAYLLYIFVSLFFLLLAPNT